MLASMSAVREGPLRVGEGVAVPREDSPAFRSAVRAWPWRKRSNGEEQVHIHSHADTVGQVAPCTGSGLTVAVADAFDEVTKFRILLTIGDKGTDVVVGRTESPESGIEVSHDVFNATDVVAVYCSGVRDAVGNGPQFVKPGTH